MTYHCGNKEGQKGLPTCEHLAIGDKVISYVEVHSDTGRHFNCPNCWERLRNEALNDNIRA